MTDCLVRCEHHDGEPMTRREMLGHMAAEHPVLFEGLGHVPPGVPWKPVIVDGEATGLSFGPFCARRAPARG